MDMQEFNLGEASIGEIRARLRWVDSLIEKARTAEAIVRHSAPAKKSEESYTTEVSADTNVERGQNVDGGQNASNQHEHSQLVQGLLDDFRTQINTLEYYKSRLGERLRKMESGGSAGPNSEKMYR